MHHDLLQPVWYVAYGSNLAAARLRCYLVGGTPTGALRPQPGARDPAPPSGDRAVALPHPLAFGGHSRKWDGGVAWLDHTRAGAAVGRAWRVTRGQLADVVAQENDLDPGAVLLDDAVLADGGTVLPAQRYGRLVALPRLDDEPALTLTRQTAPVPVPPSGAYLAMLRAGLAELGTPDAGGYLAAAAGDGAADGGR